MHVHVFEPPPARAELPARMPSPYATAPHPLARRAADELIRELRAGLAAAARLHADGGGKMFGVLVVEHRGQLGYLRAFSGMLAGSWLAEGFAPPVFDVGARDAWWLAAELELDALTVRCAELAREPARVARHAALAAMIERHAGERERLRARHAELQAARHIARATGARAAHALDHESRGDTAELRAQRARHAGELAAARARVAADAAEIAAIERDRAARSRGLYERLMAGYQLASARGERRALASLFAGVPPGGAGDCAAPKLLAHAYRIGARPIALAEVWWGAPPKAGGRREGVLYPPCRGKCEPILQFMLDGADVDPAPIFGDATAIAADEPRELYRDDDLVIVAKPPGLLSVPGRSPALADSVATRMAARDLAGAPSSTLVVHRLDLDASGVMVVARSQRVFAELQRQFAMREVEKRYLAWLAGPLASRGADAGEIALPLRVDLDDRPRQIVDHKRGKPALTRWRVVARVGERTLVELVPYTGRTHQLRVHCAHPDGLGAPIIGDRLYGDPAERLMLHAESIALTHPTTGHRLEVSTARPF